MGSNPTSPIERTWSGHERNVLTTIAFTGFTVAFFHAAIPTHWLPFVAAGRAQRWSHSKTLLITALAGTGHVLTTALLGLILTIFGAALSSRIGTWFPRIAGALLIGLGLFYIWRQLSGHAHSHTHLFSKGGYDGNEHEHEHELQEKLAHFRAPDISRTRTSDWVAIGSLFAMLTFSPCEAFLPIYVSGIRFGWGGFCPANPYSLHRRNCRNVGFTSLALLGIRSIGLGRLNAMKAWLWDRCYY